MMKSLFLQRGFTLIETIVVIVITAIVSSIVAVFIKSPVQAYVDMARRAELSDAADIATRRIIRDMRLAVPNTVRVTTVGGASGTYYLEFLQGKTGGYYRAQCSLDPCPVGEDILDFSTADSSFDVLGGFPAAPAPQPAAGDLMVLFNLGVTGASAYNGDNTATIAAGTTSTNIRLSAAKLFPFQSPGQNFQVIDTPVTYVCTQGTSGNDGTGTLTRMWGYSITASQATPPTGGTSALLARNISECEITPPENLPQPGSALVTIRLKLKQNNEEVSLYYEAHINNVP